jgi:ABC-type branched-subunit amino acid transport system ATPase component
MMTMHEGAAQMSKGQEPERADAAGGGAPAARSDATPVLVCDRVSKNFAGVRALQEVSLDVRPGEIVGMIGPNGSGKTTLLNCVSGVLQPDGGRVAVSGVDITGRQPYVCASRGVARTFQNLRLFSSLSVMENLLIGGHLLGGVRHPLRRLTQRNRRVDEVVELLDLATVVRLPAGSLAYGLQRRVEIGRALMSDPRVLLLDEPAAGMNHVEADRLSKTFAQICGLGIGVLLIEHNVSLVAAVSNHMVVLDAGKELANGQADDVLRDPQVVKAYLG